MLTRDHCDVCGSTSFTSATFKGGRLTCKGCIDRISTRQCTAQRAAQRRAFDRAVGESVPAQLALAGIELGRPRATLSGTSAMSTRIGA